jgi:hypothetical protein
MMFLLLSAASSHSGRHLHREAPAASASGLLDVLQGCLKSNADCFFSTSGGKSIGMIHRHDFDKLMLS